MKPTSAIRQPAAPDTPELRLELTCDDEPLVYCLECWVREFGEPAFWRQGGRLG